MVEGLTGRGCVRAPCVRVSGNQEEPPGRAIVSVCACAQSPGKEERPDSGREGRKFLCWSAATRRGCSKARELEIEGFPGKIRHRRHHQVHRKCRASVCVSESAISGKQSGTSPRITKASENSNPQKNRINFCSAPSNRISPSLNLSKPWITSGSCNSRKTAPEADIDFQQNSRTQPVVAKEPRGGQR